ncbi:hypothetical protein [Streptomyces sp. NBC_01190]|uniref:hypothetical protein n=1 Tax=Streptomyces sp. NBC_01190 TaxID=2903767 RepID=UPI00386FF886|nr:hypothetical protein OG519_14190 [Streptomyces sp. NBC_01190]
MRRAALLLAAAAALSVPLVAPAATASADTRLSEVICQDFSVLPQYIRYIYLTTDTPSVTEEFAENPVDLSCYEWEGSAPAAYSISYVMTGVDYPNGKTGTVSVGNGFGWTPAMPGYIYEATFTVLP